ncbi:helix-turn-helix domain-containing protein [Streptomyces sp. NPDC049954]|uniref:helix-turn-helix domain-containing protein n=1 Tax=Streptomyces sp. NPDC049954 TaxID=3155779 RepID=UPI0034258A4A
MAVTTTGPLPPGLLDRDDMRRALKEHDFAAVFALAKQHGGLSQNRIASACELTPGKVSNVINGAQQITSFEVVCRIADGLRVPGPLLGLATRPWEAVSEDEAAPVDERTGDEDEADLPWRRDATVATAARLTRSDLVLDRRAASKALAVAAVGGAALLEPLEGWLVDSPQTAPITLAGRLGIRECAELEAAARTFRQWDHKYGGGLRRKAVVGQLAEVADALQEHQTAAVEERLFRVMAQLAGMAATMSWDSGMQRRAQDYYKTALRAAHAGGDVEFGTNILAGMARQMLYRGRPKDAAELVRLAQDGARGKAGPRVLAMLHTREAWAYAAMGRVAAFRRATMQAAEALADAGPAEEEGAPYWIAYFDEAELAGVTGGRLLDLARQDPADQRCGRRGGADAVRACERPSQRALSLHGGA